jgi:hypothetical protein
MSKEPKEFLRHILDECTYLISVDHVLYRMARICNPCLFQLLNSRAGLVN